MAKKADPTLFGLICHYFDNSVAKGIYWPIRQAEGFP